MKTRFMYFFTAFFVFCAMNINCIKANDDVKSFFENSLFMGDSVLMGYSYYNQKTPMENSPFENSYFHCVKSYTLRGAIKESSDTVHPIFRGKKANYEVVMNEMKPKNVFLFFGILLIPKLGIKFLRLKYS